MAISGSQLNEFIKTTEEHAHVKGDLALLPNNPIYGYSGGANTCWFISSLQMLMNTQKYRQWLVTQSTRPALTDTVQRIQKCDILKQALKEHIHDTKKYPFNALNSPSDLMNRVIDITGFITHVTTTVNIDERVKPIVFGYFNSQQQDPGGFIGEINECLDFGCYQVGYRGIYYNEQTNELEWLKTTNHLNINKDPNITALLESGDPPSIINKGTASFPIIIPPGPLQKTRVTTIQRLLDLIPKPLSKSNPVNGDIVDDKDKFVSKLKSYSTTSLYDRFIESYEKIDRLEKYIDEVSTNLTTLFNKPRTGFSYEVNLNRWFRENNNHIIDIIVKSDATGGNTSTEIKFKPEILAQIHEVFNRTTTIKSIAGLIEGLEGGLTTGLILRVLNFHEDPGLKPILQSMYDDFFTYLPGDYIMIQPPLGDYSGAVGKKTTIMNNIVYDTPNTRYNFNGKQYLLNCIIWHTGELNGGQHYQAEINIVKPIHNSIDPGLYLCNDSATQQINNWKTVSGGNPIPALFVFENVTLTPEIVLQSPSGLRNHPPSASLSRPGGIVQVFQGNGDWNFNYPDANPNAQANADKIFAPIKTVIDDLIAKGYEHIGLTYSANQDQTAEMFNAYEFAHNETAKLSQKVLNGEIKPETFTLLGGSGQAFVLGFQKIVLSEAKYNKKFRIIPFSTMKHARALNGDSPDDKKLGSISDCISFADLFLQQPNSIILGWSSDPLKVLNEKVVLELQRSNQRNDITGWISIGGNMCRNNVKQPVNGLVLMNTYARWAFSKWNHTSQVSISSTRIPPISSAPPRAAATRSATSSAIPTGDPMKDINEAITKRILELRNGDTGKKIAILVNGGSFNPIHNGHLEMYTLARAELINKHGFHDVLIIYVVSPYNDLVGKITNEHATLDKAGNIIRPKIQIELPAKDINASIAQNIFDGPGKNDRIKICREAFASVDNVHGSSRASDQNHLSNNMFVWPIETKSAFSIDINIVEQSNVTYYGLSGSDYSSSTYFLSGINSNSIMVGRAGKKSPVFPPGIHGIFINAGSTIASKNIRPNIFKLRMFLNAITTKTDTNQIVELFKLLSADLLQNVPNSLLFRLLTYNDISPMVFQAERYGTAKYGYMKVRKWLFDEKLQTLLSKRTTVQQTLHKVADNSKLFDEKIRKNMSSLSTIKFLQMTTAHALYTEGIGHQTSLLNFANANTVGGGVLNGSTVQEETLCMMAPELYQSLLNAAGGYKYQNWGEKDWHSKFYYSSSTGTGSLIPFTTTDEFTFSTTGIFAKNTPYFGCVISAAAFDWKDQTTFGEFRTASFRYDDFQSKMITIIQNMIEVAAFIQKCDVLILGAWGCGAFAPKSERDTYIRYVAELFCNALYSPILHGGQLIKRKDLFTKVLFPIPDCNTYDIFKNAFEQREIIEQSSPAPSSGAANKFSRATATATAAAAAVATADNFLRGAPLPPPRPPSPSIIPAPTVTAHSEQLPPPYLTLTNMIANIDTSIDQYVEQLAQRNPLKEISVNESGGKPAAGAGTGTGTGVAAPKFTRVDGDYPKNTVPLYEQMVYHRAGSMNLNPLEIFIPTGYKINFQEISEYFKEMARRNDPETQELVNLVINAYGNTPSSMFYKHTLPGKVTIATSAGSRPVMVGGTYPTTTTKSVFNLDPKTAQLIQFKIDKWHRSYIDWCFYRNATRFFVEKRELPKDELVTLKMEFDEVFDAAPDGEGLMKMVKVIEEDYTKIKDHYSENVNENPKISTNSNDFKSFIYLFDILYAEIQKYKTDPLDYITERKKYFPSYSFDANSLSFMVQVFDKFRSIFIQLKLLDESAHDVKHFIETVPYLSQLETLQSITDEFMRLKQSIEMNPALKSANEIFEKYMLTSNGFIDINRQMKHIPSYNLIQYVFQTICYNNEPRATPPPPPSGPDGLFEDYVAKLYPTAPSMATPSIPSIPSIPSEPKDIFDKPIDDDFISKLYELSNSHSNPNNAEITELRKTIDKHNSLIVMLNMRKSANSQSDIVFKGKSKAKPSRSGKRQKNDEEDEEYDEAAAAGENQDKQNLTKKIKQLNEILFAYDESTDKDSYTNNDSLDDKIKQVETKIKLLKGKYFVSSLLFYNYHFVTDPESASSASSEVTIAAANFFQKFYTESKLGTPELDAFPQKNAVHFSFGIDLIFWLMFRISKYYFASFHSNFIEKLKEQIGPQNVELRSLRENVQYKESKLNHVCELVAKLLGISVVRIIPDRPSYLIKDDRVLKGFVSDTYYRQNWHDKLESGEYSSKIKYVTKEMKKGLDKSLDIVDDGGSGGTDAAKKEENDKKMKTYLLTLLEHNTVQVVHMLFAKPRDIWYSPDLRAGGFSASPKWAFFRLEKPEIISKTAFKNFKEILQLKERLGYILNKSLPFGYDSVFKIEIVDDDNFKKNSAINNKPLCVFLVATQPSPQMLAPGKDSANEVRFQNQLFSTGQIEPATNNDDSIGNKLMKKLTDAIKPDPEKCSNVRGLFRDQSNEMSLLMMDALRSGGVDMSIEMDNLKEKIKNAAAASATRDPSLSPSLSPSSLHDDLSPAELLAEAEAVQQKWQQQIIENEQLKSTINDTFVVLTNQLQDENNRLSAFTLTPPPPHVDQQMYRDNIAALVKNNNTRLMLLLHQFYGYINNLNKEYEVQKNTMTALTQAIELFNQNTNETSQLQDNLQTVVNILNTSNNSGVAILNNMKSKNMNTEWANIIAENKVIQDRIIMLQTSAPPPPHTTSNAAAAVAIAAAAAAAVPSVISPPSSPPRISREKLQRILLEGIKAKRNILFENFNALFSNLKIKIKYNLGLSTLPTIQNDQILIKKYLIEDVNFIHNLVIIKRAVNTNVDGYRQKLTDLIHISQLKYDNYARIPEIQRECTVVINQYGQFMQSLQQSNDILDRNLKKLNSLITGLERYINSPQIDNLLGRSLNEGIVGDTDKKIHDVVLQITELNKIVLLINDQIDRYPEFERSIQDTKVALLACVRRLNTEKLTEIEQIISRLVLTHKPLLDGIERLKQHPLLQEALIVEV